MTEYISNDEQLEENIPFELCGIIIENAKDNSHFPEVYRVAKWGMIEERAFLSTYSEIQMRYLEDSNKYPKDKIGTYSTSVYTERKMCDKFINLLKRSVRLRKEYPHPVIIKGRTSNGYVQRTIDREKDAEPTHVDWWIYRGKRSTVICDFVLVD